MAEFDFLPKTKRVRLRIHKTDLIRMASDDKKHKFDASIVLTQGDDTMTGMPEWIQVAYETLLKARNLQKDVNFTHNLSNVAIEIFATPKGRRTFPIIVDANLTGFQMDRTGSSDDPQIALYFSMKFPGRKEIHDWTWDHKGMECFASFEQQQGVLNMSPKPGDSEDVTDEELAEDEEDGEDYEEGEEDEDYEESDDEEATPPVIAPGPERDAVIAQSAKARQVAYDATNKVVAEAQATAAKKLKLM